MYLTNISTELSYRMTNFFSRGKAINVLIVSQNCIHCNPINQSFKHTGSFSGESICKHECWPKFCSRKVVNLHSASLFRKQLIIYSAEVIQNALQAGNDQNDSLRRSHYSTFHIWSKSKQTSRSVLDVQHRPGRLGKHLKCLLNSEI